MLYVSLGFTKFAMFGSKGIAVPALLPMYQGSPRVLILKAPLLNLTQNTWSLKIQIKEFPVLDWIKPLIPSTTLCGMHDFIPGIIGNKMKVSKKELQLWGFEDLVINQIEIESNPDFEGKFRNFLKDYTFERYKLPTETSPQDTLLRIGEPIIAERRIWIDYDNTWRSSGNKVFISLSPPTRSGLYKAAGYAEISNFIIDPVVALIFKMEYRLEMPTQDKKKRESAFFTIGWGFFIPNYTDKGEIIPGAIQWTFKIGPGTAPDGSILWTPDKKNSKDYNFNFMAQWTPKGSFDPNIIKVRAPAQSVFNPEVQEREKGDSAIPNVPNAPNIPKYDNRELKEIEDKYRLEQKINKQRDQDVKSLEDKVKQLTNQLYDKETNRARTDSNADKKQFIDDQHRNIRDLEEKYQQKMEQMKKDYELKQERMELEFEKKIQKDDRSASPKYKTDHSRGPSLSQLPYASNYLSDPNYHHPSFYPPDDRSRLIGQSRRIDEDLKILPPPPQIPLELPTTFDLSRDDEIAFVKLGIKEEILKSYSYEEPELEIEKKNPLQASDFTIRFVAFKPPLALPFGQWVPRRMYFKFNFFTFPEKLTESWILKDTDGKSDFTRELIPGQQYLLEKIGKSKSFEDFRSVESLFEIDSSISKIQDENIQFYKYLLERDLSIDIYDADSHLLYGTCRVNLRWMMKQTRPGIVRAKDWEIAAFESSNRSITGAVNMGHLQILLSHQGKKEAEVSNLHKEIIDDDNKFLEDRKQPSQRHRFNKKVKSKPIQAFYEEYISNKPEDMYERVIDTQMHIEDEDTEDIRKKMRIERVKKYKFKQKVIKDHEDRLKTAHRPEELLNVVSDPNQPEWIKNQSLKQIETLRDYTKPHVIEKVLKDHIKSMKQLYIIPGTPSFFKYNLKNPFTTKTVFTINIIDPDKIFLGETKEFKLVNNENFEWEFWYSKRECAEPEFWDMVNKRNEILLAPGEECPLLFKFVTFREFDPHKGSSELYIKERSIHIIFEYSSQLDGKGQIFETKLVVSPRNPPIDFSIAFYEPPNSHASITIPANFYANPFQAFWSNSNILWEFDTENRLRAELRTPDLDFNNPRSFLVYVYNDKFCSGLQWVLRIVIESVFCLYTKSRVGLRMDHTLTMEGDKARQVMLYSSNNRIVETTGEVMKIIPGTHNILNVGVRTYERDYKKVKINWVDINTKELIRSWLMLVESEEPKITRSIDIKLIIDRGVTKEIDFENKLNKEAVFEFASNRPDLCKPKQSHVVVGPKAIKRIEFFFLPKRAKAKGDCLIFINDEEYPVLIVLNWI